MRITSTSTYASMRESLGNSLSQVAEAQSQLGTGKRIQKASDDPVGASTALRYRTYESDHAVYASSADNATTWLNHADTQLQHLSGRLREARLIAISATNGSLSAEARQALSAELLELRSEVADLANAQHEGQAIFGGFQDKAVELRAGAWTFVGDENQIQRRVGEGVVVAANVNGKQAFGFDQPAGEDVLSVLERLATNVLTGDASVLAADQTALADRTQSVLGALGSVGATVNRISAAKSRGEQFVEQIIAERTDIEDIDMAETILKLSAAQAGYQAALGAAAKANLPSLAEFLR